MNLSYSMHLLLSKRGNVTILSELFEYLYFMSFKDNCLHSNLHFFGSFLNIIVCFMHYAVFCNSFFTSFSSLNASVWWKLATKQLYVLGLKTESNSSFFLVYDYFLKLLVLTPIL